ncbi:MAG: Npt1/Npt2 family nucleotide transporter [Gemmatimonadales bacterium]
MTNSSPPASALDRLLRLFSDVRAGEGSQALLLALNIFMVLTAYYVLKPIREALILGEWSAEVKSYLAAAMVVILVPVVHVYGRLADRFPRKRLINLVTFFFVACLVVFFLLGRAGVPLAIPFFIWVGIFSGVIIAQFWSFANDLYTNDEGERLFPIIGFGMSLGAVLGSGLTKTLVAPLGINLLMLIGAGLLLLSLVITNYVDQMQRIRTESHLAPSATTAEMPAATGQFRAATGEFKALTEEQALGSGSGEGAFALVFKTRYLLLIALMILLTNWVNTTGEYILGGTVARAAEAAVSSGTAGGLSEGQYIAGFYSDFFLVVNIVGLLAQLFLVSRIIRYAGVQVGILILPVTAMLGYGVLAFYPILAAGRVAKTLENATDYSLQNTVKNALWLPTTREQKYKAKQVVDAFFHRAGDVLSAALVFVGTTYFALKSGGFAVVNIALVLIWIAVAVAIGRRYTSLTETGQPPT